MPEGCFCWSSYCDRGPHTCICGNDCEPPHESDWSDWGIDHPEEGPSCSCGFNGTPEECLEVRERAKADFYGYKEHLSDPDFGAFRSAPASRAERMRGVRQD